jgi:hypothetical protein
MSLSRFQSPDDVTPWPTPYRGFLPFGNGLLPTLVALPGRDDATSAVGTIA